MLEIKNVYKTFNAGTVNEKIALNGLDLTLEDGDFVTVIGGKRRGQVHHAQRGGRGVAHRHGQDPHRRAGCDPPVGA